MGQMADAAGIKNADGEMNVFAPSFRRATAASLAEIKASAKPGALASQPVLHFFASALLSLVLCSLSDTFPLGFPNSFASFLPAYFLCCAGQWEGEDVGEFYGFLKRQMDPYHIIETKGYLQVAPLVGAAVYVGLLVVQEFFDDVFDAAYIIGAAIVFAPLVVLYLSV